MLIRNFKIGTRLGLGFALVLVFLTAIAVLGIWRLQGVGHATSDMASQALVKERLAADWLVSTSTNSVRTFALVKTDDPHDQEYFQKAIAKTSLSITETSGKLLAMLDTPWPRPWPRRPHPPHRIARRRTKPAPCCARCAT
jgi:methyl-accepting chemotaxis protein